MVVSHELNIIFINAMGQHSCGTINGIHTCHQADLLTTFFIFVNLYTVTNNIDSF